jgi:diadenosine tetraphosphate (Ap4A) HIT family hydrolase
LKKRNDTPPVSCLFCRWVRDDKALQTSGTVAAFNDGNPVTDGHLLIVPLRHVSDVLSLTRAEVGDSLRLIHRLVDAIKQDDPTVTGFNIGMNIGASAGQTVFHAHIHLIPRRDGDTPDPRGGVRGVIKGRRGY